MDEEEEKNDKTLIKAVVIVFISSFFLILCTLVFPVIEKYVEKDDGRTYSRDVRKDDCTLVLECNSESNLLFSKYDISVYVDDTNVGELSHGESLKIETKVQPGQRKIIFKSKDDLSVQGDMDVNIKENTYVKCTLHSKHNKIKIKNTDIHPLK